MKRKNKSNQLLFNEQKFARKGLNFSHHIFHLQKVTNVQEQTKVVEKKLKSQKKKWIKSKSQIQ